MKLLIAPQYSVCPTEYICTKMKKIDTLYISITTYYLYKKVAGSPTSYKITVPQESLPDPLYQENTLI